MSTRSRAHAWFAEHRYERAHFAHSPFWYTLGLSAVKHETLPIVGLTASGEAGAWSHDGYTWFDERGEITPGRDRAKLEAMGLRFDNDGNLL